MIEVRYEVGVMRDDEVVYRPLSLQVQDASPTALPHAGDRSIQITDSI